MAEPITVPDVKTYLGLYNADFDAKLTAMIPRARLWVEDHTGLALMQREFVERHLPERSGKIRLSRGPLVSITSVAYVDQLGAAQTYVPLSYPPSATIFHAADSDWPALGSHEAFEITYQAGYAQPENIDERLIGAMYALIEGEFSEGSAYPERAIQSAENCLAYLRQMVA